MSNINIQKHLPCHDYHMGDCPLPKGKCPYSHIGRSWGICPNKNYCPTPHKLVDCPLYLSNDCPRGDNCSYRHKKEDEKQIMKVINSSEQQKNCDMNTQILEQISEENNKSQIDNSRKEQIIKGLTVEDFKSSLIELNQDIKILMPFIQQEKERAKNNGSLDLCFIVDLTFSMSGWLSKVVSYIGSTLNTLYQDFPAIDLRVSFAGYRDYCSQSRFVNYDFTRNVEELRKRIEMVDCQNGGDEPYKLIYFILFFNSVNTHIKSVKDFLSDFIR